MPAICWFVSVCFETHDGLRDGHTSRVAHESPFGSQGLPRAHRPAPFTWRSTLLVTRSHHGDVYHHTVAQDVRRGGETLQRCPGFHERVEHTDECMWFRLHVAETGYTVASGKILLTLQLRLCLDAGGLPSPTSPSSGSSATESFWSDLHGHVCATLDPRPCVFLKGRQRSGA